MLLYHVTDAENVDAIVRQGFEGGYGDAGFGVYFYDDFELARAYASSGGWDGALSVPVVLSVQVDQAQVDRVVPHPDWPDPESYEGVWFAELDEDDGARLRVPTSRPRHGPTQIAEEPKSMSISEDIEWIRDGMAGDDPLEWQRLNEEEILELDGIPREFFDQIVASLPDAQRWQGYLLTVYEETVEFRSDFEGYEDVEDGGYASSTELLYEDEHLETMAELITWLQHEGSWAEWSEHPRPERGRLTSSSEVDYSVGPLQYTSKTAFITVKGTGRELLWPDEVNALHEGLNMVGPAPYQVPPSDG